MKGDGSAILTLDEAFEVKEVQAERIGAKLNALTNLTGDARIAVGEAGTILVRPESTK